MLLGSYLCQIFDSGILENDRFQSPQSLGLAFFQFQKNPAGFRFVYPCRFVGLGLSVWELTSTCLSGAIWDDAWRSYLDFFLYRLPNYVEMVFLDSISFPEGYHTNYAGPSFVFFVKFPILLAENCQQKLVSLVLYGLSL